MSISDRLAEHGITLPEPAAPVAAYVPAVRVGNLLHISGQLPFDAGAVMTGLPVAIVYLVFQRRVTQAIMLTAGVKG